MNAKISVVVPVYNVEPFLRDCLDSVLRQTMEDWDCVCVDDGSTDGSGAICDEYAAADPRFHVLHQRNRGLSAARNAALDWLDRNSPAEFVTFLDSDDWFALNALEEMLRGATLGDGVAAFPFEKVNAEARPSGEIPDVRWQVLSVDELWTSKSIIGSTTCGKVFSRKLFSGIRFPVGKLHEDEWTTHRVLFRVERGGIANVPLYYYRKRSDGITGQPWNAKRLRDAQQALAAQVLFFEKEQKPRLAAYRCASLAKLSCNSILEMKKTGRRFGIKHCRRMLRFCLRHRRDGRNLPIDYPVYREAHPLRFWFRKTFPSLDVRICGVIRRLRSRFD